MTDTKPPTLLEDLETAVWGGEVPEYVNGNMEAAHDRLHAFLSSDLIQKLQDPKLRAAVEVIVADLETIIELGVLGEGLLHPATIGDAVLRRIAHRASQAAQAAEKEKG